MRTRGWVVAMALGFVPGALAAQGIDEAVARVEDGTVRMGFAARPGVEVCEEGIRMGTHRMWWRSRGWDDGPSNCVEGWVEVEVEVRDGRVRDVGVVRGVRDRTANAVVLGEVDAQAAADYFMGLARSAGGDAAEEAIFPAFLADVDGLWRELLELARDRDVANDVRRSALFWIGQEAADAATEGIADLARDDDEEREVRNAAVFALSQRPDDQGVPILMEVASTAGDPETRRTAMFWLAQSGDDRVLAFFESVLLGRGGD